MLLVKSLSYKIGCGFCSYGYKDCCKGVELLFLIKIDRYVKCIKDYFGLKSSWYKNILKDSYMGC